RRGALRGAVQVAWTRSAQRRRGRTDRAEGLRRAPAERYRPARVGRRTRRPRRCVTGFEFSESRLTEVLLFSDDSSSPHSACHPLATRTQLARSTAPAHARRLLTLRCHAGGATSPLPTIH